MKLKAKLVSTIAAFCLVLCLTIVGVWAATSATVTMGGNISFKATDVNAEVSGGNFTGVSGAPTLTTLVFDGNETASDASDVTGIDTWTGWNLTFSGKTDATFKITVKNTNAERALNATLTNTTSDATNCTISVEVGEVDKDGQVVSVAKNNGTVEYIITIHIENPNLAASATLGFELLLANAG